jgi:hypothetical protein
MIVLVVVRIRVVMRQLLIIIVAPIRSLIVIQVVRRHYVQSIVVVLIQRFLIATQHFFKQIDLSLLFLFLSLRLEF